MNPIPETLVDEGQAKNEDVRAMSRVVRQRPEIKKLPEKESFPELVVAGAEAINGVLRSEPLSNFCAGETPLSNFPWIVIKEGLEVPFDSRLLRQISPRDEKNLKERSEQGFYEQFGVNLRMEPGDEVLKVISLLDQKTVEIFLMTTTYNYGRTETFSDEQRAVLGALMAAENFEVVERHGVLVGVRNPQKTIQSSVLGLTGRVYQEIGLALPIEEGFDPDRIYVATNFNLGIEIAEAETREGRNLEALMPQVNPYGVVCQR